MITDPEDQGVVDAKARLKAAQTETRRKKRDMDRAIAVYRKAAHAERVAGIEFWIAFGLRANPAATRKSVLQYLLEREERR